MPYALVPDGHKLRKVTKMQQEAISAKRSHDDAVALLSNPNTPLVIGGAALVGTGVYFGEAIAEKMLTLLEDAGEVISDAGKATIKAGSKDILRTAVLAPLAPFLLPILAPAALAQKATGVDIEKELKTVLGL